MLISLPKAWSVTGLTLLFYFPLLAQIDLPVFFADHMVLQRDRPIRIWGTAPVGEQLRVSMEDRVTVVRADENGQWMATMGSIPVGGPYSLEIKGSTSYRKLEDVWIGEVWLCMGQSNMEWPLSKTDSYEQVRTQIDFPNLRYFKVRKDMAMQPEEQLSGGSWQRASAETVGDFSGVAFHFAQSKSTQENVPIGIIEASWGATGIRTWMGPNALRKDSSLAATLATMEGLDLDKVQDSLANAALSWRERFDQYDLGLSEGWASLTTTDLDWPQMNLPEIWERGGPLLVDGVVWFKKDFELKAEQLEQDIVLSLGVLDDEETVYLNGVELPVENFSFRSFRTYTLSKEQLQLGRNTLSVKIRDYGYVGGFLGQPEDLQLIQGDWSLPLEGSWRYQWGTPELPAKPLTLGPNAYPGLVYNAMVHPLTQLTIGGILWYQGESDLNDPFHYRKLLLDLVDDYRQRWKIGDFPFLIVQLPYFRTPLLHPAESGWATLRESQAYPLRRRQIGLVSQIDLGSTNNIHPTNKRDLGGRCAQIARILDEQRPLSFGGAQVEAIENLDSVLLLSFTEVGAGLQSSLPEQLPGFAVAGEDGKFHWAEAQLVSAHTIRLRSKEVPVPLFVRYAWADNPGSLDLFDGHGLPVPPFRTDKLKVPWE
ncbi:MAG: hypothetical protein HRU41_17785 [Saprospiraceae bacterium]|nr:hypothetical protein [Saprospiraceae bacterium]